MHNGVNGKTKGARMKTEKDLRRMLADMDRRGYPALKGLRGSYRMEGFVLTVDHVQGDPFAAPSKLSVFVPAGASAGEKRPGGRRDGADRSTAAGPIPSFPPELFSTPERRCALEDLLVRRFGREAAQVSHKVGGSGKSGLIATSRPGPEVLPRSACTVDARGVTLRFEAGFPAHGRTVDARALARMLTELVPRCVRRALAADAGALEAARRAADLADDQAAVRAELERRDLVAFVADGAVLPRESGVSARPLAGAKPFRAPASMRVVLDLPHRGPTPGLGIRRGVTLVVGGGYHGKSTLLKALQEGVYNHVAGDGRELVITCADAVKLRAEDGRSVRDVDISLFIDNLPDGRDTRRFSTADASGSTSQAAGAIESVEAGCRALLIDEDTSATNFMVRDALMEAVVAADHEPITPFVERVRDLWERAGVSSVIVVGSSGAFFSVADAVIQMDRYEALDVTERVRQVCAERSVAPAPRAAGFALPAEGRRLALGGPTPARPAYASGPRDGGAAAGGGRGPRPARADERGDRGRQGGGRRGPRGGAGADQRVKVRSSGLDSLSVGSGTADVRLVEQLVDPEQTAALAHMVRALQQRGLLDGGRTLAQAVDALYAELEREGWRVLSERGYAACGLALPRRQELIACLNRWRGR